MLFTEVLGLLEQNASTLPLKVVVFGIGQFSETVRTYLDADTKINVIGHTVDAAYLAGEKVFKGLPIVAWEELERTFPPNDVLLFGPISFRSCNKFRRDRFQDGKARGYSFLTYIHPSSHVYADRIGENCLILEQNCIQPYSEIGDNVILWSTNHVGHHSRIGDHCFLAGHVGIAGNCQIGEESFFGAKSGIIDGKTVGAGCIIGANVMLTKDLRAGSVAASPSYRVVEGAADRVAKAVM